MSKPDALVESEEKEILGSTVEDLGTVKSERKNIIIVEGMVKKSIQSIHYFASCGHIVHQATDLGGRCGQKNCGAIGCKLCIRVCSRCLKTICPKHTKLHSGLPYCPWCKWLVMLGLTQCQQSYKTTGEDST